MPESREGARRKRSGGAPERARPVSRTLSGRSRAGRIPPPPDLAQEIAEAWQRERPETPVESIGIVTRIWRLAKLFSENRRRVLAETGTDGATLDLLSTLRRSGRPYTLTTRDITERTLVTAGAISQRIARAERQGLVRRRPDEHSRAVWVELTRQGHGVIEETVDFLLRQELELLGVLDPEQRATLATLLHTLVDDVPRRLESGFGRGGDDA